MSNNQLGWIKSDCPFGSLSYVEDQVGKIVEPVPYNIICDEIQLKMSLNFKIKKKNLKKNL
jgi:hypothetical protein